MQTSTVDEAILSRMSVRAFTQQPVSRLLVQEVLAAAAQSVSDAAMAGWKVHVLQGASRDSLCRKACSAHDAMRADPALLVQYREQFDYYPEKWVSPYIDRRRENGWGLYGLLGIGKTEKDKMHAQHQRNFRFFDAPTGLIFTVRRSGGCATLLHYGAFLQAIMVAARLHGLHTCPQAAWGGFASIILPHVGAASEDVLVCAMALGYADDAAPVNGFQTPRLAVAEFARWLA